MSYDTWKTTEPDPAPWAAEGPTKACARCGESVPIERGDVIGRQVLCANCWELSLSTQQRKAEDEQREKGAA